MRNIFIDQKKFPFVEQIIPAFDMGMVLTFRHIAQLRVVVRMRVRTKAVFKIHLDASRLPVEQKTPQYRKQRGAFDSYHAQHGYNVIDRPGLIGVNGKGVVFARLHHHIMILRKRLRRQRGFPRRYFRQDFFDDHG